MCGIMCQPPIFTLGGLLKLALIDKPNIFVWHVIWKTYAASISIELTFFFFFFVLCTLLLMKLKFQFVRDRLLHVQIPEVLHYHWYGDSAAKLETHHKVFRHPQPVRQKSKWLCSYAFWEETWQVPVVPIIYNFGSWDCTPFMHWIFNSMWFVKGDVYMDKR